MISTTTLTCPIASLPKDLDGLRIVQFSDLHLNDSMSNGFLKRLKQSILNLNPDLIVFTGDFLCYSKFNEKDRVKKFLCELNAPYGCFAILGNHDYEKPVLVNMATGNYDVLERKSGDVVAGLKLLIERPPLTGKVTEAARALGFHQELMDLLKETPFQLLHNETLKIPVGDSFLNVVGLGEHTLGRNRPDVAFEEYDQNYPGVILSHNPDSLPALEKFPGDLILCGHTHGAQINLPFLWNRFTLMENPQYKRGRFQLSNKMVYVNKGVGSVFKFRLFAKPEVTCITLKESL